MCVCVCVCARAQDAIALASMFGSRATREVLLELMLLDANLTLPRDAPLLPTHSLHASTSFGPAGSLPEGMALMDPASATLANGPATANGMGPAHSLAAAMAAAPPPPLCKLQVGALGDIACVCCWRHSWRLRMGGCMPWVQRVRAAACWRSWLRILWLRYPAATCPGCEGAAACWRSWLCVGSNKPWVRQCGLLRRLGVAAFGWLLRAVGTSTCRRLQDGSHGGCVGGRVRGSTNLLHFPVPAWCCRCWCYGRRTCPRCGMGTAWRWPPTRL